MNKFWFLSKISGPSLSWLGIKPRPARQTLFQLATAAVWDPEHEHCNTSVPRVWQIGFALDNCFFFLCLGFFVSLEYFLLIWRRHHDRWRAANFDQCSALMAIEQWGFLSVPHLLWHRASEYNHHLRGPVTITRIAECLIWQWSC